MRVTQYPWRRFATAVRSSVERAPSALDDEHRLGVEVEVERGYIGVVVVLEEAQADAVPFRVQAHDDAHEIGVAGQGPGELAGPGRRCLLEGPRRHPQLEARAARGVAHGGDLVVMIPREVESVDDDRGRLEVQVLAQ